jgi:hypothetical protein
MTFITDTPGPDGQIVRHFQVPARFAFNELDQAYLAAQSATKAREDDPENPARYLAERDALNRLQNRVHLAQQTLQSRYQQQFPDHDLPTRPTHPSPCPVCDKA